MKTLNFSVSINASREKVWSVLWDDANYREWTSVFTEGSYAVSNWEEGDKVLFLSANGSGMFSVIAKKIRNEFMSFKHLGVVKEGKELEADEATKAWSGCTENYTLKENAGTTELSVTIEVIESHEDYFRTTFPKALDKVKVISER